MYLCSWYRLV